MEFFPCNFLLRISEDALRCRVRVRYVSFGILVYDALGHRLEQSSITLFTLPQSVLCTYALGCIAHEAGHGRPLICFHCDQGEAGIEQLPVFAPNLSVCAPAAFLHYKSG